MEILQPGFVLGQFIIENRLGHGSFSTVFRARLISEPNLQVALKVIDRNVECSEELFTIEKYVLQNSIDFPYIVHMLDSFETQEFFVIVIEYVENKSLAQCMLLYGSISNYENIFTQLILSIQFLHDKLHVIHCDIKTENILVDNAGNIRLADFGLAKIFEPGKTKVAKVGGSLKAIAPEQIQNGYTCPESDIWSAGILLYELVFNRLPYDDKSTEQLVKKIAYQGLKFDDSITISNDVKILIQQMLLKDPEQRLTCEEILNSSILKNLATKFQDKIEQFKNIGFSELSMEEKIIKLKEMSMTPLQKDRIKIMVHASKIPYTKILLKPTPNLQQCRGILAPKSLTSCTKKIPISPIVITHKMTGRTLTLTPNC